MKIVIATAPTIEPVTVSEAKAQLRITASENNTYISNCIKTAREYVEQMTSRAILTQTWDYYLDEFPGRDYYKLPYGNLQSITHVKYTDSDGTQTTMTKTTEYIEEKNGQQCGRVVLPYGVTWPSFAEYPSNAIVTRFQCGWTTEASVPYRIKQAILLIISDLYLNREWQVMSGQTYQVNHTVEQLLSSITLRDQFDW